MKSKTIVKVLSMLLVAVMLLTACTPAASDPTTEPQANNSGETTPGATEAAKEYWQMLGEVSDTSELPTWTGEKLSITVWASGGTDAVLGTISNTNVTWKEFERVTGVSINLEESYGNGGESIDAKLPKIVASGDYPTIVYGWAGDSQMRELYDNGLLVDLTPYFGTGDLYGVEYWLPLEQYKDTAAYANKITENGEVFLIPSEVKPAAHYGDNYTVSQYDPEYYQMYGAAPTYAGGFVSTQAIWVRDDILTAIYPDAMTLDEIQALYIENGTFTQEEIFDVGLETTEDFYDFLRAVQAELAAGDYVGLDGKAMEVTYGPNTETDNWDWLNMLPAYAGGFCANTDYFVNFINDNDASTPLFVQSWENPKFVDFMRNMNALVNENVISKNSLVDNSATFKEKVQNAHYAVVYGNSARSSMPKETDYETLVSWGYRPVYLSQMPDQTIGGLQTGGVIASYFGIFKGDLTDEQIEQVVHALSYVASPVGINNFVWGPKSAGLFTEDANGVRTFTDADLAANILNKVDNEAAFNYGITGGTCSTQTPFGALLSIQGLGGKLMDARYLALGTMDRSKNDATTYFNPGIYTEYSLNDTAKFMNTNVNIYGYGTSVSEGLKEWWAARPGFEKQLTKLMVSDPAAFDAELKALDDYAHSVGYTDEALNEFIQSFVEANKGRLDEAGIVY